MCFRLIVNPRLALFAQGYRELLERNISSVSTSVLCVVQRGLRRSLSAFAGICSEVRLTEAVNANPAQDDYIRTDVREAWN